MNHVDSCNFALLERRVTELEKQCKNLILALANAQHELALHRPIGPCVFPYTTPVVPQVYPWIQPSEPYSPVITFTSDG